MHKKLLFLLSLLFNFDSQSISLNFLKNKFSFLLPKNNNQVYIKYKLSEMSETIPHKIFLIIQELKNPELDFNLSLNRLLIHGPHGNGKSTYAKKIANEIDAILIELSAPSLVTSYQGSGAENINNSFNEALSEEQKTNKKIVIFIDEIDAIASTKLKRTDNKSATQALWLNLDRIKKNKNIFVIMATNHFKDLNPTLLDRFGDNIIEISNPNEQMRKEVIEFYLKQFNYADNEINVNELIKKTNGFSIRAIEEILRSIKRISKIQNTNSTEIISKVLEAQKTKLKKDWLENVQKHHQFLTVANLILSFPAHIISCITLYNIISNYKLPFLSNVAEPMRPFPST